jgi:hypothetical protein
MARQLAFAAVGIFSMSLLLAGTGGAVVCDPLCAPSKANGGGEVKGLNRANAVAVDHGAEGRANAAAKQDDNKPGGSGVVTDTGGSTGGTTDTSGGGTSSGEPPAGF